MIDGTDPVLGTDGVTMSTGTYTPTEVCDLGLADKLGIPATYLRGMRAAAGLYELVDCCVLQENGCRKLYLLVMMVTPPAKEHAAQDARHEDGPLWCSLLSVHHAVLRQ